MRFYKEFVVCGFDATTGEVDVTTEEWFQGDVKEADGSYAPWGALLLPELKGADVKRGTHITFYVCLFEEA